MKYLLLILIFIVSGCSSIDLEQGYSSNMIIYQTNKYGEIQYHKPSYVNINGSIYQTDSIGNIMYHKGSFKRGK